MNYVATIPIAEAEPLATVALATEEFEDFLAVVERSFGVSLAPDLLPNPIGVDALINRVQEQLPAAEGYSCAREMGLQRLYRALNHQNPSLDVAALTPGTLLADLMPRRGRRAAWEALGRELGLKMPKLVPPRLLMQALSLLMLVSLLAAMAGVAVFFASFFGADVRLLGRALLVGGAVGFGLSLLGTALSARVATCCPHKTLGEMSDWLAAHHFSAIRGVQRSAGTDVAPLVQLLLAEYTHLTPEQVHPGLSLVVRD